MAQCEHFDTQEQASEFGKRFKGDPFGQYVRVGPGRVMDRKLKVELFVANDDGRLFRRGWFTQEQIDEMHARND